LWFSYLRLLLSGGSSAHKKTALMERLGINRFFTARKLLKSQR
jgi:hypothetical protein